MSLYLVGMRAVGKSTAGRLAASRLGVRFVDTDDEVERRSGSDIATIFATVGEPGFRALEREVVLGSVAEEQLVAVGAGAVHDDVVRATLRSTGRAVWLDAELGVVRARLGCVVRPSLTGLDPVLEAGAVLAERKPLYRECACTRIDVTGLSVSEVADELERIWAMPANHIVR